MHCESSFWVKIFVTLLECGYEKRDLMRWDVGYDRGVIDFTASDVFLGATV